MIDPVAAFDQLDAVFRSHATMIAAYYKRLKDNGVPPTLAKELTKDLHTQTIKLLNQKGTS